MAIYLDTETTGISPGSGDAIVEVAIVNERGETLLNTLVNPLRNIPWYATKVHGITDAMVAGAPTLEELMPTIRKVIKKQEVVIYNATFDVPFFPGHLSEAASIHCAMRRFAQYTGSRTWRKLDFAAQCAGHVWTGAAHRALADTQACRSVWRWVEANQKKRA